VSKCVPFLSSGPSRDLRDGLNTMATDRLDESDGWDLSGPFQVGKVIHGLNF
jgi:hypothetical protein